MSSSVSVKQSCSWTTSSSRNGSRDAGLRVGVLRGVDRRLPAQEVEVRVALGVLGDRDRHRLHEHGIVAEALREVGAREHARGRAVGLRGAVVEPERPRDDARLEHVLHGDLALEHRLRRERAVVVVLDRDLREVLAAGAERLEVARGAEREPARGRGGQAAHFVEGDRGTGDAAVLRLVEADHEHGVVHARGDREDAEAERVGAGLAVVGDQADRLAEQLERLGDLGGALARVDRAREHRLDPALRVVDARVGVGLVGGVDDHVLARLVPVLAELARADADHRHLVANRLRHRSCLARERARLPEVVGLAARVVDLAEHVLDRAARARPLRAARWSSAPGRGSRRPRSSP